MGGPQGLDPRRDLPGRVLTLRKDPKYDNPYVLQIRNGPGQVIGQGAVKMLKAEVSLSLLLPEFDARRLSLVILDYIRAWKQVHFPEIGRTRVRVGTDDGAARPREGFRAAASPVGNGEVRAAAGGPRGAAAGAGRAASARRVAFEPRPGPRSAAAGGG